MTGPKQAWPNHGTRRQRYRWFRQICRKHTGGSYCRKVSRWRRSPNGERRDDATEGPALWGSSAYLPKTLPLPPTAEKAPPDRLGSTKNHCSRLFVLTARSMSYRRFQRGFSAVTFLVNAKILLPKRLTLFAIGRQTKNLSESTARTKPLKCPPSRGATVLLQRVERRGEQCSYAGQLWIAQASEPLSWSSGLDIGLRAGPFQASGR
jgi:hypothetical protein